MSRFIFQCLSLAVLLVMAITGLAEYFDIHPYYSSLLGNTKNRALVLWAIIGSLIPLATLFFSKKVTLKNFLISLLVGVIFYGVCLVSIRGGLFGLGIILLSWNTFVLLGLGIVQTGIFLAIGDTLKQKLLPDAVWTRGRVGIALTLGISIQLLVVYVLMLLNILFPIVSWILFIVAIWYMRSYRKVLLGSRQLVVEGVAEVKNMLYAESFSKKLLGYLSIVLILVSIRYVLNGFELSFMPYSTAWDANHVYMFYPKMRSFNNGIYWLEPSMQTTPHLWYAFLTFWFSLFGWSDGIGAVSSDTIVLSLNFWSGVYVLLLGVLLVKTFLAKKKKAILGFLTGWGLLLIRLTSGMGAFLVFVDNKTDMGVLALIIGALLTGFAVLNDLKGNGISKRERIGLIISGALYAIAALAKPTAMFDVVNFVMYMRGIVLGPLGVVMIGLIAVGLLTMIKFNGIKDYLPQSWGVFFASGGILLGIGNLLQNSQKKILFGIKVFMIRGIAFTATMIVVKAPFLIGKVVVQDWKPSGGDIIKSIFLTKNTLPLLAQSGDVDLSATCSLAGQGFTKTEQLYDTVKVSRGSKQNEDNLRYTGFGWKGNAGDLRREIIPFKSTWWTPLVPSGCTVVNLQHRDELKSLCENIGAIRKFDTGVITTLANQIDVPQGWSDILDELAVAISENTDPENVLQSRLNPKIQELLVAVESSTIYNDVQTGEVYMPYKRIVPFNVSYNRSLQNLSSYYTDIGIMWLVCFIFSVVGIIYGLIHNKKQVLVSSMVTFTAWILRWFIASGIVWYSIGLIVRSLLSFIIFVSSLFEGHEEDDERPLQQIMKYGFLFVLGVMIAIHLVLNMVRIASQGGNNAFMRYKSSVGKLPVYDASLQTTNKTITGFGKDEVFGMQFPHYKPFINAMNARDEGEGGFIAGTYIRYFVTDQSGVKYDQFLSWLWEQFSDNSVCNSYLRLQDQSIRYMAIDLNIGTVVQGEGNRSLFDRFFARVNSATNEIEEEGTISMLIALAQQGYVTYISSNNIGAKYAFTIPDSSFDGLNEEQLRLFKSRMAVARYFLNDQQLLQSIAQIAEQRVVDGTFVTDIADMIGLSIREDKLIAVARKQQITGADINELSQDERRVFSQYLGFRNMQQSDQNQFAAMLQNAIRSSIRNPNQILALEVVE